LGAFCGKYHRILKPYGAIDNFYVADNKQKADNKNPQQGLLAKGCVLI